jgi:hypothetical protein
VPMPIQHPPNQQRMRNPKVQHKMPRHRHPLELLLAANKNASFSYIMERKLPFSQYPWKEIIKCMWNCKFLKKLKK